MSTRIPRDQFIEKLQALKESEVPIRFSLSVRAWPGPASSGHGIISAIEGNTVQIEGRAGGLRLVLEDKAEYRVSGHYALSAVQKANLPEDLHFMRLKRVRALQVIATQWEVSLVFA